LLTVLSKPYEARPEYRSYQLPPDDGGIGYRTFCGT
jgi:serine/tyrosine/threonine adenylyltransferase